MYDRSALREAARNHGDSHYTDVARRLDVSPVTAWRLWHGKFAPSAGTLAAVHHHYGLTAAALLAPAEATA